MTKLFIGKPLKAGKENYHTQMNIYKNHFNKIFKIGDKDMVNNENNNKIEST
jgi:hypothetical protein